jgi:hypothetical protein
MYFSSPYSSEQMSRASTPAIKGNSKRSSAKGKAQNSERLI